MQKIVINCTKCTICIFSQIQSKPLSKGELIQCEKFHAIWLCPICEDITFLKVRKLKEVISKRHIVCNCTKMFSKCSKCGKFAHYEGKCLACGNVTKKRRVGH